jgi:hypothetical protein
VRCPDARSAQIGRPDGVARSFQVSANKIEPGKPLLACNLLTKDDCRLALADEIEPDRPEVPLVGKPVVLAGGAERLAGTAAGPYGTVVSSQLKGVGPTADAGEEVALPVGAEIAWKNQSYIPVIDISRRQQAGSDQIAQPLRAVGIVVVIIVHLGLRRDFPASDMAIATACLRLFTLGPLLLPECSVPRLNSPITLCSLVVFAMFSS